jgi:biotin transport system substrate-specific component
MFTVAPQLLGFRLGASSRARTAALVVGFALATGAAAQWKVYLPFTPVPITGQTMAVLLCGAVLGMRAGAASQLLYLGLGAVGLPLFADASSGVHVLVGPTAGYLAGFVVAAAVIGRLAEARADRRVISAVPAFALGSVVIYACGVIGLMITLGWGLSEAFAKGVVPFLVGDAIKAAAAGLLLPAMWRARQ